MQNIDLLLTVLFNPRIQISFFTEKSSGSDSTPYVLFDCIRRAFDK